MKMASLMIFTPTYNRSIELTKLYESLIKQTNRDFHWFVIDDGSNDNTKSVVNKWIHENKIKISYIYKNNGGKHTAFNTALDIVDEYLNVCVDSDDIVTPNMVDRILEDFNIFKNDPNIVALAYPNAYGKIDFEIDDSSKGILINGWSISNEISGVKEAIRVFKPNVLKGLRYPIFEDETFFPEDFLLAKVYEKGNLLYFPIPLVIGDYLEGGLSRSISNTILNSSEGYLFSRKIIYKILKESNINNKTVMKLKILTQIMAVNLANKKSIFYCVPNRVLGLLFFPFAYLYYMKKFFQNDEV